MLKFECKVELKKGTNSFFLGFLFIMSECNFYFFFFVTRQGWVISLTHVWTIWVQMTFDYKAHTVLACRFGFWAFQVSFNYISFLFSDLTSNFFIYFYFYHLFFLLFTNLFYFLRNCKKKKYKKYMWAILTIYLWISDSIVLISSLLNLFAWFTC